MKMPLLSRLFGKLLEQDWIVQLEHVYREANSAADFLATYNLNFPIGLHVLISPPPPEIVGILYKDAYGIAHSLLVLPYLPESPF